jgi:pyruvate/2-oxoglutarate dehydrogenase complex dihydrolipoamide acyltransferase (E2) component
MTIEDMAGGTFTISNGGIYGSLMGKFDIILWI